MNRKIAFRLDGGHSLGMGNIVRCMALADELLRRQPVECLFVMKSDPVGVTYVEKRGFTVAPISSDNVLEPIGILKDFGPDVIFNDILYTQHDYMIGIKDIATIINYDDIGDGRVLADIVIDATPKPNTAELGGIPYYHGPDYLLLRSEFLRLRQSGFKREIADRPRRILVLMGGSDPTNLTIRAVGELDNIQDKLNVDVVVGSGYRSKDELADILDKSMHSISLHSNIGVEHLLQLMLNADVGIVQCGVSAYEMACTGLPFVAIAHSDIEDKFGRVGEFGFCLYLGWGQNIRTGDIGASILSLLTNRRLRLDLSLRGMRIVDSCGLTRVASLIFETLDGVSC